MSGLSTRRWPEQAVPRSWLDGLREVGTGGCPLCEDVLFMLENGESLAGALPRAGVSVAAMERHLRSARATGHHPPRRPTGGAE